jgi:hypothetical protein
MAKNLWLAFTAISRRTFFSAFFCLWSVHTTALADNMHRAEEVAARSVFKAYFDAKDSRHYRQAYTYLSKIDQQSMGYDNWKTMADEFNRHAGQVRQRQITKVSWYDNPPNATPGLYCTLDFVATFENVDRLVGYIALIREDNGRFAILREEQNFVNIKNMP